MRWRGGELPGRVGVDADRKPDLRPQPLHLGGLAELDVVVGGENRERAFEAGGARTRHDRLEIAGELRTGDVAVTVDHGWKR